MKWSQNIKSLYQQWKQARDGKNLSNIYPSSDEPSKQSPYNSTEIQELQETINDSKNKILYDWKQIYKSKAYRNDSLQNFVSYQHPKLVNYENDKVFNLATDFISDEVLIPDVQKVNQEALRLKNNQQVKEILNVFYNKALLDRSLEQYDTNELTKHFYYSSESPNESHIYKMAAVINRYIKNLLEEIMKKQIKNLENQKISFTEEQYKSNQEAIIQALRSIILNNNTEPYQLYYITNQGLMLVNIYSHWALDWNKIEKSQIEPQNI